MSEQVQNDQSTAILKELSDIKSSLAVNTTETGNIKSTITEIKGDIKDIKADSISRREFNEIMTARDTEAKAYYKKVDRLWDWRWMIIGGAAVLAFITEYFFRLFTKN